jgi:hypothetical protein
MCVRNRMLHSQAIWMVEYSLQVRDSRNEWWKQHLWSVQRFISARDASFLTPSQASAKSENEMPIVERVGREEIFRFAGNLPFSWGPLRPVDRRDPSPVENIHG